MQFDSRLIACVIVLFEPAHSVFHLVASLSRFGYSVVLVNNTCDQGLLTKLSEISNVHVLGQGRNLGLARAINSGVDFSFEVLSVQFIILFDQDSSPEPGMPYELSVELAKKMTNEKIASISPVLIDQKAPNAYCPTRHLFNRADPGSVPTSGTLIPKDAWLKIGPMLDDLFIDGIDHEWCFRACSLHFNVIVSTEHSMVHNMGDSGFSLFGVYKPIHRSPARHYFIVRNAIFLSSLSYIPLKWRILELFKTIRRFFAYILFSTNRPQSLRLMGRAIYDGVLKKLGPLDSVGFTD